MFSFIFQALGNLYTGICLILHSSPNKVHIYYFIPFSPFVSPLRQSIMIPICENEETDDQSM